VRTPADLDKLSDCVMFVLVIVLQHNPPPIMRLILRRALAGLSRHGIAYFQIPTYMPGYTFDTATYLKAAPDGPVMEMHCLPQRDVFELLANSDCVPLEVQRDASIGNPDNWLSYTFLAQKHG
jgi:hypothetical protein